MIDLKAPQRTKQYTPSAINHYRGEAGARYFLYQSRFADVVAQLSARKFAKYIRPSDVVLDFGCGGGFLLSLLNCTRRLGIEINPIARRTAEANGLTCFETLDEIGDQTLDVAISHHSLEHVPSPLFILAELQLKLKPGGLLLLIVPIDDWRTQKRYDPSEINHHLYTWTPLLLGHLLSEAGFDTKTLSTAIGTNGWFHGFPKYYGKLPQPFFDLLSRFWCTLRRTREIYAIVRKADVSIAPGVGGG
jgi:SAM-dependent methyltransferase